MSVQQFMSGRELPCNVLELLSIRPLPLPGTAHEALVGQVEAGKGYPDVLYRLGLSHLARQELGLAAGRFEAAIAQKGDYAAPRLALAGTYDLLARPGDAADQLDAALGAFEAEGSTTEGTASRYAVLCAAGFCLERLGNLGAAVYRYEEALAAGPTDLFARYRLAAMCLSHNQIEEAVEHHRAILAEEPQEGAVRTSLAHLLQLLGRHNEAVWEYQKALCLAPDCWELQLELAQQFERMGDSDQAISHLKQLSEKNPHFPDLHLRLANLYSSRGEDEQATGAYRAALALHPDYLDGHIAFARHELGMGRTESSLEHFHSAATINQQNVEAYAGLAVAQHRLGKVEEAKESLACAWKIAGNSDVLVAQLGLLELQAEAAESADQMFDPNRQVLGDVTMGEALSAEADSVHLEPGSRMGEAKKPSTEVDAARQRQWVEMQIARYEEILREHPAWADVHMRYGMVLKLVGRLEDAAAAFEKAIQQNAGYSDAWVQLGLLKQQAGDAKGAIGALETAIQIQPTYADLHYRLALIYCNEMEFDLALERLEEAVAINGKNPDFRRQLWVAVQGLQLSGRRAGATVRVEAGSPSEAA